jgi:hypothetical protein
MWPERACCSALCTTPLMSPAACRSLSHATWGIVGCVRLRWAIIVGAVSAMVSRRLPRPRRGGEAWHQHSSFQAQLSSHEVVT